jgi:membrane-bound lytic murein transglycosylase F
MRRRDPKPAIVLTLTALLILGTGIATLLKPEPELPPPPENILPEPETNPLDSLMLVLKRPRGREGKLSRLSPYDSLIRAHADSLGWDWHLLAAVIYQESRFNTEARSSRGAEGLMQMMPATARKYGVTDPLDPEQSIAAGARMLGKLIRRYYPVGDNMTERYKYALAAYNAGVGRIDDCLRVARLLGTDTSYWLNVVNHALPRMQDEAILASGAVRSGPFRGEETVRYVDSVISLYQRFCRICP